MESLNMSLKDLDIESLSKVELVKKFVAIIKKQKHKHELELASKEGTIECLKDYVEESRHKHELELLKLKERLGVEFQQLAVKMQKQIQKSLTLDILEKVEVLIEAESDKTQTKVDDIESSIETLSQTVSDATKENRFFIEKEEEHRTKELDKIKTSLKTDIVNHIVEEVPPHVNEQIGEELTKVEEKMAEKRDEAMDILRKEHDTKLALMKVEYAGQVIEFDQETAPVEGLIVSKLGQTISCENEEGGGACLNIGLEDRGLYEWVFRYHDLEEGQEENKVLFGVSNHNPPLTWKPNCVDTHLWNPGNGERFTADYEVQQSASRAKHGTLIKFRMDFCGVVDEKVEPQCFINNKMMWYWPSGASKIMYPTIVYTGKGAKVTLVSFQRMM
eukprot:TRINITY_DN792_c0_g1_i4.p1 TRINITY_DN792_c0_g1~~TRINITY_DN792_c0_g1_i4.p1  ORF type:complete len:389 (+),score=120.34 TRINITY_DN792_c0_g1_i4:87-1253(+)